jgi:formate C-acetyltransferase
MIDMPQTELTYADRLRLLRERKMEQTREKIAARGYMDVDDHGSVEPPAGWHWEPTPNHPNGGFYGCKGWGDNFRSLMEAHPTYVDPADALAGRWCFSLFATWYKGWNPDFDFSHLKAEQELYGIIPGIGGAQHFGPDFRMGLELGWGGLLDKVRHCRGVHGPQEAAFYEAHENVILGVQNLIGRTAAEIRKAEECETRPELKKNLREMAEMNEWLVSGPPRTLREACQWIAWYSLISRAYNGDGAGSQLDELLRPYYERELAAGLIDDETAIFYLACLLLNDTHYYQLGGPGADGRDQTTRLSYLILEAAHRLNATNNLTIRVHDGLDREFFLKSVRHLFEDRKGWPRYSGDKGLTEGFMRNGYTASLARERIAVGCHWMAIPGREYTLNDVVKINVAKVFEAAFREMMNESPGDASIANLYGRFSEHLRRAVLCTARGIDFHLAHQKDNQPELMLNLLSHGPIEKGLDASDGGLEFYNMCIDGSALATTADSFAALEQRIEREKVLTWAGIAEHLKNDYGGAEGERVRLMMKHGPRYGQGGSLGDEWAVRISRLFTGLVKAGPTPGGRNLIPGWFSWANTIGMGKILGATPNGRRAGEPISHGANPDPGFRRDGAPTAMARAIAAVQPGYGNTAPIQLELDPGLSKDEGGVEKIAALIETHFDLGGTLFNINVVDAEKIREAHKDPSKYPDLVVRVTGFTAYFAALSPAFRQLVVDRLIAE